MSTTTNSVSTTIPGWTATRSLFELLRAAMGNAPKNPTELNADEWTELYNLAARQSLLGVVFYAIRQAYPDAESRIPKDLYLKWFYQAESVRALNQTHYELSQKLTALFAQKGFKSVIMKGQANSRLYPDKFIRQTGDIDIWLSGGREKVIKNLLDMGLLEGAIIAEHAVAIPKSVFGTEVEVHFDFIHHDQNPFANRRLLHELSLEVEKGITVGEGFGVPTLKFALLMQLSHIRRHLLGQGIGLRQIMDYAVLLNTSTEEDRIETAKCLTSTGLRPMAGALMWVLSNYFGIGDYRLLCKPDEKRGRRLLKAAMSDGNFGKKGERTSDGVVRWWLRNRLHLFKMLPFDFKEVSWFLLRYWASFLFNMPQRITAYVNYKKK